MILPYENFIGDSDGEELIWRLFKQELPKEYISFHGYRACTRKPDIMLLVPDLGILVIENKSIHAKSIAKVLNNDTILRFNGPQIPSPLKQADRCGIALLEQVLKPGGIDSVMVYHAVSYPYINEEQFFEKHLDKISSRELTFLKEDFINFETIKHRVDKIFELAYATIDVPTISKGGFNLVLMDQVANLISPHYKEDLPTEEKKKAEKLQKEVPTVHPDYSIICNITVTL